ncbi:helix-turn-helix domain-containing protein [Anoxybacillus sp. ST70]|uniref:helix-turn-helix domain-containing protein n=1 Tax=Anoxybacillus sp. ST70 TaxID=2864180 RepID=UPI001C6F7D35|nr:helix-turn-helix domain-containing protein [Anoxybacillus sp. ST70]
MALLFIYLKVNILFSEVLKVLVQLEKGKRLPYKPKITADMLPYLRQFRGYSQKEFADLMGVSQSVLSQLETGKLALSEYYEKKIRKAIHRLRISNEEIEYIKRSLEIRNSRGW